MKLLAPLYKHKTLTAHLSVKFPIWAFECLQTVSIIVLQLTPLHDKKWHLEQTVKLMKKANRDNKKSTLMLCVASKHVKHQVSY
jgi:hypothetical protein